MPAYSLPGHLVSSPQLSVRGVIFDMDGLLLNSDALAIEAQMRAGRDLGHNLSRSFCVHMIGLVEGRYASKMRETFGEDFPAEELFALQAQYMKYYLEEGRLRIKRGVLPLLDLLDTRHIPRAIVTSSGWEEARNQLRHVSLIERFDAIVTREDVVHGTPDAETYLVASSRIGVVPELCLVLEDSTSGASSALAAGMRVIVVPDLTEPTPEVREEALAVVSDLTVVQDYVARYGR